MISSINSHASHAVISSFPSHFIFEHLLLGKTVTTGLKVKATKAQKHEPEMETSIHLSYRLDNKQSHITPTEYPLTIHLSQCRRLLYGPHHPAAVLLSLGLGSDQRRRASTAVPTAGPVGQRSQPGGL